MPVHDILHRVWCFWYQYIDTIAVSYQEWGVRNGQTYMFWWKLKDSALGVTKQENAAKMKQMLEALNGNVPGLVKLEVGIDFSATDVSGISSCIRNFRIARRSMHISPSEHQKCVCVRQGSGERTPTGRLRRLACARHVSDRVTLLQRHAELDAQVWTSATYPPAESGVKHIVLTAKSMFRA